MSVAEPRVSALGGTYFAYFATVGLEYIYLPFFFATIGLDGFEIGVIYAGRIAAGMVCQPSITRLADRLSKPHLVLKTGLVAGFGCACLLLLAQGFVMAALAMWLQASLRSVAIPLLDASTLRARGPQRYGRVRMWGSLGFGVSAALFGQHVQALDYAGAGALVLPAYLLANGACALTVLTLPRDELPERQAEGAPLPPLVLGAPLLAFLCWNALHWSAVESFTIYFSWRTRELGLPSDVPGQGTLVSIVAEIAMLLAFARLSRRFDAEKLALTAIVVSAARWIANAVATDATTLVALQSLHAFSFGLWYASALAMLGRFAPPERRATLQGVFSAAVLGAGGAAGILTSGWLVDELGSTAMYAVAAATDLGALALALATYRLWARRAVAPRSSS